MIIHRGGSVSMVNLTGATWPQLQSPFAIGREGSLQETWFSLAMVSSWVGFRPSLHPALKTDDRLQDGVSPSCLTLAPTMKVK